jgi:hypothetical protein
MKILLVIPICYIARIKNDYCKRTSKTTDYEITWDENDPLEKQLNHWTEEDFFGQLGKNLKKMNYDKYSKVHQTHQCLTKSS